MPPSYGRCDVSLDTQSSIRKLQFIHISDYPIIRGEEGNRRW